MQKLTELTNIISEELQSGKNVREVHAHLKDYCGEDWKNLTNFKPNEYTRVMIHKEPAFEIRLLCWSGQQKSNVHNHPTRGCSMKVLQGQLLEELYDVDTLTLQGSTVLPLGSISYIHDQAGVHRICNLEETPAVSLHVYAPGGYEPVIYPMLKK